MALDIERNMNIKIKPKNKKEEKEMKANNEDRGWGKMVEYLALSYNAIVLAISVAVFMLIAKS
jgi:hypothetical protein